MVLRTKKETTTPLHHRKRQANHHKRTKDYEKHYWPYLPLLVIVGLGFGLNSMWTPLSSVMTQRDVLGYATNTSPIGLLDETNLRRTDNGLAGLNVNSQLTKAAQAKAEDMATRDYWSHTTPDGKEPWWFVSNTGYNYLTVGENLAYGFDTSTSTVAGWMNSAAHRANLLNANFQDVGFGIANSANYQTNGQETIIVAMYGKSAVPPVATAGSVSQSATGQPIATPPGTAQAMAELDPAVTAIQTTNAEDDTVVPATLGSNTFAEVSATVNGPPQAVTRLETVATTVPAEGIAATIFIIAAAAALFIYRHARALHRRFVHSEEFIVHHPYLDVLLVSGITIGFVLTRTAGFIN